MSQAVYWDLETNSYYIHKYYSPKFWDYLSNQDREISSRLLDYKDQRNNKAYGYFTYDLMSALAAIAENDFQRNRLLLVSVPCSDPNKVPTTSKSIEMIAKMSADGTVKSFTQCNIPFIDASNLLMRTEAIRSAHKSNDRPKLKDHIRTISLTTNESLKSNAGYVIIDDIVTTGTQMQACNHILRSGGVKARNIIQLAIGKTFRL